METIELSKLSRFNFLNPKIRDFYKIKKGKRHLDNKDNSSKVNQNSFLDFWNRLIHLPNSEEFSKDSKIHFHVNTKLSSLADDIIRKILSQNKELSLSPDRINDAIQKSKKIYHEDFPGDFILEYEGKRLGMLLLDKCYDQFNDAKFTYRYKPGLISFRGIF